MGIELNPQQVETQVSKSDDLITEIENKNIVSNKNISQAIYVQLLNPEQCKSIINSVETELWEDGGVSGNPDVKYLRKVKTQALPVGQNGWPYTIINELLQFVNKEKYKFDCTGILDNDLPQILKYEENDYFDWHIDVGNEYPTRKLSFIIQLSDEKDYEGGDIEMLNAKLTPLSKKQGSVIIFPSYLTHKIKKITKGTRYSIVGWIHGNSFK